MELTNATNALANAQNALTITPHPLTLVDQKHVAYELVPGETLGAFLRRHVDNMDSGAWVVTIGGYEVPAKLWEKTFPKHGTIIECRSVVQKQAVALIAIVALSMFAPYLAGAAYGALGGTFVAANAGLVVGAMSAAITVAGSLIINKVLGPKQPDAGSMRDNQASPTYSLTGGRNRSRQFEPIGMLFGELRVTPDFAGMPYSWFEGDEQWLYSVFHAGINVSTVTDVRIGQTPIANYSDIYTNADGIYGLVSQPLGAWTDVDSIAGAALVGGSPGAWVTRTSSANAVALQADLEGSVYAVDSKGKIVKAGTGFEGQYRLLPNGAWIGFTPINGGYIESASTKPVRRTYTVNVSPGQYEVRFRKMDPDLEATDRVSKLVWSQLKTVQSDTGTYGGMGRLGVRIKASGQINGALDEVNWLATQKPMDYWNGNAWVVATNRGNGLSNPGAQFLQFARGIRDSNGKLIAGLGLADSQIDVESLQGFMVWCAAVGATFDYWMDSPTSCQDILEAIAAVGMGTVTWQSGKLGVAWASDSQPIQGVVNMATMKAKTFSVGYQTLDTADSIEYAYYDREKGYTWQTLRVSDPSVGTSLNPARISSIGVTSAGHAAILARFHLAQSIYQRKDITFDTDLEHLTYKRMSVLALTHDVTQWGYGGRLDAVTNNGGFLTLTLDDVVPAGSGARYIGLRVPGEVGYRVFGVNAFSGSSRTITLSTAWPGGLPVPGATSGNPACDTIWIYDFKSTPGYKVRVTGIQPQPGLMGATVTVVPESPEFWTYVFSGSYIPLTNQSLLTKPAASRLTVTEELQRQGNTFYVDLTATFDVDGLYDHAEVWVSINGASYVYLGDARGQRFTWRGGVADVLDVEIRPFDGLGRLGDLTRGRYVVTGLSTPPSDVPWIALEGNTITWGTVPDIDLAGYLLRYHYGSNRSWGDANPLHAGVVTESPFTPDSLPQGPITLMVKSIDTAGNESGAAALIQARLGDVIVANVVEARDWQAMGFPGTITGGSVVGGVLKANGTSTFYGGQQADFFKQGDSLAFYTDLFSHMVYETPIFTPTMAALGSNMTFALDIASGGVLIEYRVSGGDPMFSTVGNDPFYKDGALPFYGQPDVYQPWPGQITAKNLQYQFRITTYQSSTQGVINVCNVVVDVPDKIAHINSVTIGASGTRLPLPVSFLEIENVQLTLLSDGGTAVSVQIADKSASLGPLIRCLNSAGALVSGRVDAIVQGY